MTAATLPAASPPAPRSRWFHSAPFDLLLVLCVPVFTWPLVTLGQQSLGAPLLNQLILLSASGHYLATFVRAYGDRELFERFRSRFLFFPVLLLLVCLGAFTSGHGPALQLVTAGWAFWHWLAQAFGFARIYDSKAGSFRPLTAWLDKALVVVGFTGAIVWNDEFLATFAKTFLAAGVPLPTAAGFAPVRMLVVGAMVLVGAAYVVNLVAAIVRRQPWSWQKQVMHVTTIGYYWFAFGWQANVLVGYVLYELFHDTQYYAITWLTCRQRLRRPGTTAWFRFLFRPGLLAAVVFVAAMYAYGAVDMLARDLGPATQGLFLAAALLHYYYDGFVWKARESALARDLGIDGGLRAAVVPGLRHAALWALFFVPLLGLLVAGRPAPGPRERAAALVALAPGDFLSQAELAYELFKAREVPAAIEHYRAAVAANPGFAQARANFGNALDFAGEATAAREQYEAALANHDPGSAHAQAHVNLGVLLLLAGDRAAAQRHFADGQRLGGEPPIGRMLALASALPEDRIERRRQLLAAVLQLDANQPDAHLGLAGMLAAQHRSDEAAVHFQAVLQQAPDYVPALVGLATAQWETGRQDAARATLQRAAQREPGNAQVQALQARFAGR